jgi:nucleoside-diphosphate-sugar epimerase
MRRYFLTGCTGWLGRAIVAEILRRPDTEAVTLLTRDPESARTVSSDSRVRLWHGDVLDRPFPADEYTHLIHGANGSHFTEPMACYYTIVEGTRRIMAWAEERGIGSILYLSSGAVHRGTPYGRGKLLAEHMLPFRATIARLYTFVGEDTPCHYAVGGFIRQALTERRVTCAGGESVVRSYLHVEDAARWILTILEKGYQKRPYDVGGDAPWSIRSVAVAVASVFGVPLEATPAQGADSYLPNTAAAKLLGARATIPLIEALERIRDATRIRNPDLESAGSSL